MNATKWIERWEAQQTAYLPERESRFQTMFDVLESHFADQPLRVLDLCCGCGSLSARLQQRFPDAEIIALDLDPVLLELGKQTLQGIHWVQANLLESTWADNLGTFHAVLSTTALHWLPHSALAQVYRAVYKRLEPLGVVLNGDHFAFAPHQRQTAKLALSAKQQRQSKAWATGQEDWATWWKAIEAEPSLELLLLERQKLFPKDTIRYAAAPNFDFHAACLSDAGFTEISTIWQNMDNRVLLGIKGEI